MNNNEQEVLLANDDSSKPRKIPAVKKLKQLGFDPIEKMVELYNKINIQLEAMDHKQDLMLDGFKGHGYSGIVHATLLATQQKLTNDLMRYKYARVSEADTEMAVKPPPIFIQLTKNAGSVYEIAPRDITDDGYSEDPQE